MKAIKRSILFLVLVILTASASLNKDDEKELLYTMNQMYTSEDYFILNRMFQEEKAELSEYHSKYFEALLAHKFNKQKESNRIIDEILAKNYDQKNDSLDHKLYRAKLMNHINLYEYSEAADISLIIANKYKKYEDSTDYQNLLNEYKIWNALRTTEKQQIEKTDNSFIKLDRDKVGFMNINTKINKDSVNFIFDTGANFSFIIRSLVDKLGMEELDADFYVTSATGKQVSCNLAVAKEISISNMLVKNVVFLVMEDEDMSFPQIEYYPNGAIGFPVIEALEELQFDNTGSIFIPMNPFPYKEENLALSGLMPVIAVKYESDTLNFNFDTGGQTTILYKPFFEKYKEELLSKNEFESFAAGSGGGIKEFNGMILDSLQLSVASSIAVIDEVRLHTDDVSISAERVHGNFGQDYIKQFDRMIISFKYSSVLFKNN